MVGDKLDCPNCGYPYSEEYLESMIWKSFKCEQCFVKIKVRVLKGYLRPIIRHDRMAYFKKKKEEVENHKYMRDNLPKFIKDVCKKFNEELLRQFFENGKMDWVRQARKDFFFWCITLDIPQITIIRFFEKNNGIIDERTIKSYLDEQQG